VLKKSHSNGPLPSELHTVSHVKQYGSLKWGFITIKTSKNDSAVSLVNGDIVQVQNIVCVGDQTSIV
jgi:hypothetical protein